MKKGIKNFLEKEVNAQILLEWSVYLFVFTLPLWRTINTICIWPMVIFWVLSSGWKSKGEMLKKNKVSFFLATSIHFLFWIGLLFSTDQKDNFSDIERTLPMLIFPLVILSTKPMCFDLKRVMIALGIGLFVGMVICWFNVLLDIFSKSDPREQATYFFQWVYSDWRLLKPLEMHPSYFAVMIVLFISTIIFNSIFKKLRKRRVFFSLILILFLVFLLQTSSRIAFFLFILIVVVNTVKGVDRRKAVLSFLGIVIAMVLSFQFDYLTTKFQKIVHKDGSIKFERFHRWKGIMEVFLESKDYLFGTGAGDVNEVYNDAYKRGNFDLALSQNYNAHNQFLEFFVSNGLIGPILYLVVLFHFLLKTKSSRICIDFFLIIVIFSITESIFGRSKGVFFFAFFYSIFINQFSKIQKKKILS